MELPEIIEVLQDLHDTESQTAALCDQNTGYSVAAAKYKRRAQALKLVLEMLVKEL